MSDEYAPCSFGSFDDFDDDDVYECMALPEGRSRSLSLENEEIYDDIAGENDALMADDIYDDIAGGDDDELMAELEELEQEEQDICMAAPIVLDTGMHTVKAGLAGEIKPKVEVRTLIGRPRHQVYITSLKGAIQSILSPWHCINLVPRPSFL